MTPADLALNARERIKCLRQAAVPGSRLDSAFYDEAIDGWESALSRIERLTAALRGEVAECLRLIAGDFHPNVTAADIFRIHGSMAKSALAQIDAALAAEPGERAT